MVAAALTGLAVLLFLVRSPPRDSEEKDPATILLDRSPSSIPSAAMEPVSPHQGSIPGLENLPAVTWQELVEGTPGIGFRSIKQLDDDPALMQQMQEDLENFRRYGSIGQGRVTTEFTATDELRKALEANGLPSMLAGLAFQPVLLSDLLPGEVSLIGAVEQGKMVADLGWAGLFQSALHKDGVRQLELSEVQQEFEVGDSVEVIKEFINGTVGDVPATIQRMSDEQGASVFTIEWSEKGRSVSLSTKAYEEAEALELARRIQQRYRELPYAGWRQPYRLDPQRPWHRMAKDGK